jgi:hypothetical protein
MFAKMNVSPRIIHDDHSALPDMIFRPGETDWPHVGRPVLAIHNDNVVFPAGQGMQILRGGKVLTFSKIEWPEQDFDVFDPVRSERVGERMMLGCVVLDGSHRFAALRKEERRAAAAEFEDVLIRPALLVHEVDRGKRPPRHPEIQWTSFPNGKAPQITRKI